MINAADDAIDANPNVTAEKAMRLI